MVNCVLSPYKCYLSSLQKFGVGSFCMLKTYSLGLWVHSKNESANI